VHQTGIAQLRIELARLATPEIVQQRRSGERDRVRAEIAAVQQDQLVRLRAAPHEDIRAQASTRGARRSSSMLIRKS